MSDIFQAGDTVQASSQPESLHEREGIAVTTHHVSASRIRLFLRISARGSRTSQGRRTAIDFHMKGTNLLCAD